MIFPKHAIVNVHGRLVVHDQFSCKAGSHSLLQTVHCGFDERRILKRLKRVRFGRRSCVSAPSTDDVVDRRVATRRCVPMHQAPHPSRPRTVEEPACAQASGFHKFRMTALAYLFRCVDQDDDQIQDPQEEAGACQCRPRSYWQASQTSFWSG